jgi:hypothetical protein
MRWPNDLKGKTFISVGVPSASREKVTIYSSTGLLRGINRPANYNG